MLVEKEIQYDLKLIEKVFERKNVFFISSRHLPMDSPAVKKFLKKNHLTVIKRSAAMFVIKEMPGKIPFYPYMYL